MYRINFPGGLNTFIPNLEIIDIQWLEFYSKAYFKSPFLMKAKGQFINLELEE